MKVTLSRLEAGMYTVRRGPSQPNPPVLVLAGNRGWDVVRAGIGVGGFPTFRAARAWLDSEDGQAFLDGLPGEGT